MRNTLTAPAAAITAVSILMSPVRGVARDVGDAPAGGPESTSANDTGSGPSNGLEQLAVVTVSAQRRDETLDKVPISITAFNQQQMDDLHLESFADLATIVPGLRIPTSGAGSQSSTTVAIRGVISNNNAATTAIYIDDTAISVRQINAAGFSGSPQPDIFDLERIEVLRGPQGTLFGSSAMGGAIRYITPTPNLNSTSGYAKAEGSYTDRGAPSYAIGAAYGAPVVQDMAGFRVSAYYHSDGGFIDIEDPYSGQIVNRNANRSESLTLRPAFTVAPTDGLTITPAVFIQRIHSDEPPEYWTTLLPVFEHGAHADGFGTTVGQPIHDNLTLPTLTIKYDLPGVSLQSVTAYLDRSYQDFDDYTYILPELFGASPLDPGLVGFSSYDKNIVWTHAWQQEFKVSSAGTHRFNWVGGLYFRHALDGVSQYITPDLTQLTEVAFGLNSLDTFNQVPNFVQNGVVYNSYTRFTTVTQQTALFGEASYNIVGGLKASVGLRVERSEVKDQHQEFAGPLDGAAFAVVDEPDAKETPVTPRYNLTYQLTDQDMVYITAAKGYRAGGSNSPIATQNPQCAASVEQLGLTSVPESFKSDSLWSYEAGAKGSFFNRRLQMEASVFYIDWKGIQTNVQLPSCGQSYTANRGNVVSQGFDFQISALLAEGLKFGGNVGYTNAYYPKEQRGLADDSGNSPLIVGAGDKVGVLPWTAAASLEYSRSLGDLWQGARSYLRFDYRWQDGGPVPNKNTAGYNPLILPDQAYSLLNVRLGIVRGGLDVSLFGDNLTKSDPRLGVNNANQGPLSYAVAIRPLTAGLTAFYRF